jgi:hypothetical protein
LARRNLREVAMGGKHGSEVPLPNIHLLPATRKLAGHRPAVLGLCHQPLKLHAAAQLGARRLLDVAPMERGTVDGDSATARSFGLKESLPRCSSAAIRCILPLILNGDIRAVR